MNRQSAAALFACAWLAGSSPNFAAAAEKPIVKSQTDLPRFSYPITGTASALAASDDATFNVFSDSVRANLEHVLADFDIEDPSMLRDLLTEKFNLQELQHDYAGALQTVDRVRALEEKPAGKLMSGLLARTRLLAARQVGAGAGAAYTDEYATLLKEALDPLPWDVVHESAKESYLESRVMTRALALGVVLTDLDPAVAKSGALNEAQAERLIVARVRLKSDIPVAGRTAEVLHGYIAAHSVTKPDIWAARDVTLESNAHLNPVRVAIWDSGVDVAVFPGRVFSDPQPTKSGVHGLAFDDQGLPSTSWLFPLTKAQEEQYPAARAVIKGFVDIQNGVDSSDADSLLYKMNSLSPEEAHALLKELETNFHYIHGTHCAGIAARGNPAIRLVVARFNDQLTEFEFAPTEEWAQRLAADFAQMSAYFRSRRVRVVNMSWMDEPFEFETWLSKTGGGADPGVRKQRAAKLYAMWRAAIEAAIKSAPDTLFVNAAGNTDSDPAFMDSVPTALHLPNLIVVGAVDQAGDETSFTSHGKVVSVYANGYEVESLVPGGSKIKMSGTSMAAPNVVNLAAKLFAIDPSLTPSQVIALIKDGATDSADGRIKLIDEKRSVAMLRTKAHKAS